jgi:hypothetical protein
MQSLAAKGARPQPLLARRRPGAAGRRALAASAPSPLAGRRHRRAPAAAAADEAQAPTAAPGEPDLEEEVERFMRKQAELESGGE